jgi:hypothetical protein
MGLVDDHRREIGLERGLADQLVEAALVVAVLNHG